MTDPIHCPMLDQLFDRGQVWQRHQYSSPPAIDTGFATLNQHLPGAGWPAAGVTEILYPQHGIGELSLLLPSLAKLSQRELWIIWVGPPWRLNAPALAAAGVDVRRILVVSPAQNTGILWALEEGLKSGAASAVLGWPQQASSTQVRRLQICAAQHEVPCFVFRHQRPGGQNQQTPSALRLQLKPLSTDRVEIRILKQRRGWPAAPFPFTLQRCPAFRYPAGSTPSTGDAGRAGGLGGSGNK
ncbi:translesion DNA synthesis-associated protein ImuA [Exilibacterium tricleocarpae]|uniref:Translesion DNA synthesis-associated protein ImuA n=1 Tax=Exilibacterium tricleocarpae TaxID=2591008 RepID=A0A545SQN2_9GAMM|nr:translesion DNA synthesis-associated protein ImuA [Exilibacterium tricleocarpae]TQV67293.1 translesion DNA synthesis-associated protein ImuA [Exilibacterium tricleocarpae]